MEARTVDSQISSVRPPIPLVETSLQWNAMLEVKRSQPGLGVIISTVSVTTSWEDGGAADMSLIWGLRHP